MVKISLDEAYALDILSIYEVKIRNCTDTSKVESSKNAYNQLYKELSESFGSQKIQTIIQSKEYRSLYDANERTFYLVDKVRATKENSLGKDVDDANMDRFFCKRKLQEKFFDNKLVEVKTQYE